MLYNIDMKILLILLLGLGILAGAVALNLIVSPLALTGWYEFVTRTEEADIASIIWLFFVYPLGLGAIAYWLVKFFKL